MNLKSKLKKCKTIIKDAFPPCTIINQTYIINGRKVDMNNLTENDKKIIQQTEEASKKMNEAFSAMDKAFKCANEAFEKIFK